MMGTRENISSNKRFMTTGFTLIELVVVIAIMAVLIGLIVPSFAENIANNKKKACRQNREAILAVYQRCLFDSSISDIILDTDSLGKVIPQSLGATWTTTFKPIENEVGAYRNCRTKGTESGNSYSVAGNYGVDAASKTAWIKCPDCGDVVSVDLVSWHVNSVASTDDEKVTKPEPTETPNPAKKYTVTFYNNGYGEITFTNPQEVKEGERAANPGNLANTPTRTFVCWSEKTSGTSVDAYDFDTPIMADKKLYALWVGVNTYAVWPYADDMTWWDPAYFNHGSEISGSPHISGDGNNMYVNLKAPSGVFTSASGQQFVLIEAAGSSAQIYYYEAASPEYYSAIHPNYLVQLTGNVYNYDITGLKDNDQSIRMPAPIINGDLVIFNDGGTKYEYVYWHDQDVNQNPYNLGEIRKYASHPNNLYRVNKP